MVELPFSRRLRKLKSLRGIFLPFFISVSPIPSVNGQLSPPTAAILVFPPLDIEMRRNVKSRFAQEEKGTGETRISRRMKREGERERVYVLLAESDEEKSKKWSAINGKRNRQRMENNWRKMEARISKENASRWKKGGSSREGDSCLDSLLVFRLLLYLGVMKREAGPLRRSWWREGRGRGVCEPAREREKERDQLEPFYPFLSLSLPSPPSKVTLWTLSIILFLYCNCSPLDSVEGIRLGVSLWY